MKPIDSRGIRSLVAATTLNVWLGFVTHSSVQAQPFSYLIGLDAKTADGPRDADAGQVVGSSDTSKGHAFIPSSNGKGMAGGWNREQLPDDSEIQPFGTLQYFDLDKPSPAGGIDVDVDHGNRTNRNNDLTKPLIP